ncbi:MAG: galactokinase [Micrococcales bacterium]
MIWSAPGRVNLIGEHTDYNEGFVLPFAIDRRTFAEVNLRADNLARVSSDFSPETVEIAVDQIQPRDDWAAYPLGVAWAIQQLSGNPGQGFDAHIRSEVPVGAGLSSSAAIECAVGTALNELWQAGLTKQQLARAGQLGENEIVGAPTGIMDQSASIFGKADHAVFLDCRTLEIENVPLSFEEYDLELLVIDTRVAHRLVDGGYAERRAACERAAAAFGVDSLRDLSESDLPKAKEILDDVTYRRMRHVITENARVLKTVATLKSEGPLAIGDLLIASHASMRDDFEISIEELDVAVETSMAHGAIGARMTGGGFGGAAIALVPKSKTAQISAAVIAEFSARGFEIPNTFTVTASAGAQRDS